MTDDLNFESTEKVEPEVATEKQEQTSEATDLEATQLDQDDSKQQETEPEVLAEWGGRRITPKDVPTLLTESILHQKRADQLQEKLRVMERQLSDRANSLSPSQTQPQVPVPPADYDRADVLVTGPSHADWPKLEKELGLKGGITSDQVRNVIREELNYVNKSNEQIALEQKHRDLNIWQAQYHTEMAKAKTPIPDNINNIAAQKAYAPNKPIDEIKEDYKIYVEALMRKQGVLKPEVKAMEAKTKRTTKALEQAQPDGNAGTANTMTEEEVEKTLDRLLGSEGGFDLT